MASLKFHTPLTGSTFTVRATGTLAGGFEGYLVIDVAVSNSNASYPTRALTHFKRSLPLKNTTSVDDNYDTTHTLAIVPKQTKGDKVSVSWVLSETP